MVKHTVVANFLHLVCQDFFTRHWKMRHKLDCLLALFVALSETLLKWKAQHSLSKPTLSVCRQVAMVHANYKLLLYLPADKAITRRFLVQNPLCDWFYLPAFSKLQQPLASLLGVHIGLPTGLQACMAEVSCFLYTMKCILLCPGCFSLPAWKESSRRIKSQMNLLDNVRQCFRTPPSYE